MAAKLRLGAASTTAQMDVLEGRTLLSAIPWYASSDHSGITQGPDGHMWLIDANADRIRRVTAGGDVRAFTFPGDDGTPLDLANDIAAGGDGKLWFGLNDGAGWRLARLSTAGTLEIITDPEAGMIEQVEAGPDGSIWISRHGGVIARVDAAGQITVVNAGGLTDVFDLEAGPDGSMWFTGFGRIAEEGDPGEIGWVTRYDVIGKISADGVVEMFSVAGFGSVTDIVRADDGFLYFGAIGAIGRVSTHGEIEAIHLAGINPVDLTAGPGGAVWFVDLNDPLNPLSTLSADGSLDRFAAKGPDQQINALATGVDGRLWYTTGPENVIARFNPTSGLGGQARRLNVQHKKLFSEVVGSFTDFAKTGRARDYEALIDWGNGETTPGQFTRRADGGGFDVVGENRIRFGWHTLRITVIVRHAPQRDISFESVAYVVPAAMAGKGRTIEPIAGQTFRGTLATYIGPDPEDLSRYTARVDWGDGEWSDAELVAASNGAVKVVGAHLYLRPGQYDVHVMIHERETQSGFRNEVLRFDDIIMGKASAAAVADDRSRVSADNVHIDDGRPIQSLGQSFGTPSPFNDARTRAVVQRGVVDGDAIDLDVYAGQRFNEVVARFETTEGDDAIAHYRAEIDLGTGGNPINGVIEATKDGRFVVRLARVLTATRSHTLTVRIYDDRRPANFGTIGVVIGAIRVNSPLVVDVHAISAIAGVPFDGKVGTLHSVGSGTGWASEFEVIIRWGDGKKSRGWAVPRGDGNYDIHGTHTYDFVGYHRDVSVVVEVVETRQPIDPGLPPGPFRYMASDYPDWDEQSHVAPGLYAGFTLTRPLWQSGAFMTGVQGDAYVATLTVGDPTIPIDHYFGVVAWDDGTESVVRFVRNYQYVQVFDIRATHTFATAGSHSGVLTVGGPGEEETFEVHAYAYDPAPQPKRPVAHVMAREISAVDGVEFSDVVGHFRPRDADALLSDFVVTIYWGDGESSVGGLAWTAEGLVEVRGVHIFRLTEDNTNESIRWFRLRVRKGDESADDGERATVFRNPERLYADGRSMHFRQRQEFTSKVATITSPDEDAAPEDFEAWIEWGDGTRTRGVVTRGHRDRFEVAGTHTYQRSGYLSVRITVTGPGGTDLATSSISLDPDPVVVEPTRPEADGLKIAGLKISGRVATFIDEEGRSLNPDSYLVYHAALIDWGDGEITFGVIGEREDGSYEVIGSHRYEKAGEYTVSLVVRRNTRHLPQLPRWNRYHHRTHGLVFLGTATNDGRAIVQATDKKDEYAQVLFTVRVKKAKKDAPPKRDDRRPRCRKGEKPKRDNCRVVQKKKKRSGQNQTGQAPRPAAATSWFKASLFGRTRIGQ